MSASFVPIVTPSDLLCRCGVHSCHGSKERKETGRILPSPDDGKQEERKDGKQEESEDGKQKESKNGKQKERKDRRL